MSTLSAQELREIGNKKFRELNYGAALMRYTEAINKEPTNYALYYNRAVTLIKMDAFDESKSDLLASIEIKPDYIPSLCQLGFVYLYEGDTPNSLETYVKAVKANEQLPHSLYRFRAQLKQAISLAKSRCLQQEYSQAFIDEIITPDVKAIIESYPALPNHMIESGIPPVSFGNVPTQRMIMEPIGVSTTNFSIPMGPNANGQRGLFSTSPATNAGSPLVVPPAPLPPGLHFIHFPPSNGTTPTGNTNHTNNTTNTNNPIRTTTTTTTTTTSANRSNADTTSANASNIHPLDIANLHRTAVERANELRQQTVNARTELRNGREAAANTRNAAASVTVNGSAPVNTASNESRSDVLNSEYPDPEGPEIEPDLHVGSSSETTRSSAQAGSVISSLANGMGTFVRTIVTSATNNARPTETNDTESDIETITVTDLD